MKNQLLSQIHDHTAVIAVIGLGYVGLPLAVAFAESGFPVVGIDVDPSKVDAINQGRSYISDISSDRVRQLTIDHSPPSCLTATTDYSLLAGCDVAIICVPTRLERGLQFA